MTEEQSFAQLQAEAPDLAQLVREERLKLNAAWPILETRTRKQERKAATIQLYTILGELAAKDEPEEIAQSLLDYDEETLSRMGLTVSLAIWEKAIVSLTNAKPSGKSPMPAPDTRMPGVSQTPQFSKL